MGWNDRRNTGDNTPAKVKTIAWLTYDDRYFYIGVRCEDPNPQKIRAPYVESWNLGLRLPVFRIGAPNKTTTSTQRGRGAIDFAQVLSANANRHSEQSSTCKR